MGLHFITENDGSFRAETEETGGDPRAVWHLPQRTTVSRGGEVLLRAEVVTMKAAELGHEDCLKAGLKAGANVNTSVKHFSALQKAAGNGHHTCVDLLLNAGADVNHKDQLKHNSFGSKQQAMANASALIY